MFSPGGRLEESANQLREVVIRRSHSPPFYPQDKVVGRERENLLSIAFVKELIINGLLCAGFVQWMLWMQEAEAIRHPSTQDSKRQHSSQASCMQYEIFFTSTVIFPFVLFTS